MTALQPGRLALRDFLRETDHDHDKSLSILDLGWCALVHDRERFALYSFCDPIAWAWAMISKNRKLQPNYLVPNSEQVVLAYMNTVQLTHHVLMVTQLLQTTL